MECLANWQIPCLAFARRLGSRNERTRYVSEQDAGNLEERDQHEPDGMREQGMPLLTRIGRQALVPAT